MNIRHALLSLGLVVTSGCAPASPQAQPVNAAQKSATPSQLATDARAAEADALPALPAASGARFDDGKFAVLPTAARAFLEDVGCTGFREEKVDVVTPPGAAGASDFMVVDVPGPAYGYWIRSFSGPGDVIGFLVQAPACPGLKNGMYAFIKNGTDKPVNVTDRLMRGGGSSAEDSVSAYETAGASELFADITRLGMVPVVRWISEADPDRPLPDDKRTLSGGMLVHGGFLVWSNDRFVIQDSVAKTQWPCPEAKPSLCVDNDPFVSDK